MIHAGEIWGITMRRVLISSLGILAFLSASARGHTATGSLGLDNHVGPPQAHRNLGNYGTPTVSWLERSVSLSAAGYISFGCFGDSQNSDRLELLIDGSTATAMSGFHRVGEWAAPLSSGNHTIRFQYAKDGMVDEGLDTVWVDDVRIFSNSQLIVQDSFSGAVGCNIPDWTPGGFGGGWCVSGGPEGREIRRPVAMAFAGYQSTQQVAGLERTIEWPASTGNALSVTYFVDSEEAYDALRILIDGSPALEVSGRMRSGTSNIPVSGGVHQVRIEYVKDESGDEGLDEARVTSLEVRSGGRTIQLGGFDGAAPEAAVPGWTPTSNSGALSWSIVRPRPPVIGTTPDTVLRTIDGALTSTEYDLSARLLLADLTQSIGVAGRKLASLLKFVSSQSGHVGIGIELSDDLGSWVRTGAKFILLVDSAELAGNVAGGCGTSGAMPGPNTRKFDVAWDSAGTQTIAQSVGQCSTTNPWRAALDAEKWSFAAGRRLDTDTVGVTIEIDLVPSRPVGAYANSPIAMMLQVEANVPGFGNTAFLTLPARAVPVPSEFDPSTWEEIWLGPTVLQPSLAGRRQIDAWQK